MGTTETLDLGIIKEYLWSFRNTPQHDTPFNHGFISFEVKAPLFVQNQLVKHEYLVSSVFSRRYKTDSLEFLKHKYRKAADNPKDGSSGLISKEDQDWLGGLADSGNVAQVERYNIMIDNGVCPEQARGQLPQDLMTYWTWSGSFGAFAKMCTLRCHPEAQEESRVVADMIYSELVKQWPVSAPMLVNGI